MTARIAFSRHAGLRIEQRLAPRFGHLGAAMLVAEAVLDADQQRRWRRRAPQWSRSRDIPAGADARYAVARTDHGEVLIVANAAGPAPHVITVIAEWLPPVPACRRQLPPVPVMPDGRVIGKPRVGELPVAFRAAA